MGRAQREPWVVVIEEARACCGVGRVASEDAVFDFI